MVWLKRIGKQADLEYTLNTRQRRDLGYTKKISSL